MSSRTYNLLIIIAVNNGLLLLDLKILLILYLSGLFPIPVFGSVLYWVLWDLVLAWDLDSRMEFGLMAFICLKQMRFRKNLSKISLLNIKCVIFRFYNILCRNNYNNFYVYSP